MNVRVGLCASMLGMAVCMGAAVSPATAQVQEEQQHVVALDDLNKRFKALREELVHADQTNSTMDTKHLEEYLAVRNRQKTESGRTWPARPRNRRHFVSQSG